MKLLKYCGLFFVGFVVLTIFGTFVLLSLSENGVSQFSNTWDEAKIYFQALKYILIVAFYIYFEQCALWMAKRKGNLDLKEVYVSKKHLFFVPIIIIEVLGFL